MIDIEHDQGTDSLVSIVLGSIDNIVKHPLFWELIISWTSIDD